MMEKNKINGAESLVKTLIDSDDDVCFTNPGTTEMHFVAALDNNPKMRSVLCLFEGGATEPQIYYNEKTCFHITSFGPWFS